MRRLQASAQGDRGAPRRQVLHLSAEAFAAESAAEREAERHPFVHVGAVARAWLRDMGVI